MRELSSVSLYKNGSLHFSLNSQPSFIDDGIVDIEFNEITAIDFCFKENKRVNKNIKEKALSKGYSNEIAEKVAEDCEYSNHFYFVGNVVDFDQLKNNIKIPEEYKKSKFAVTYDDNGNILDCRVLSSDMHPVQSKKELFEIYASIIGYTLPGIGEEDYSK